MYTDDPILIPELRGQRTLAAIVFTDVVNYSALMAANEEYTLDLLRRDFQIMNELCQRFQGKILKTIGDALLMYFTSAVQAVACAQQIQSSLAQAAANLAPEEILTHRIGIHLGDVFFNGTDLMGDGVNIAARLQAEAEPGGICISQTVYEVVKNPLALKATNLVSKKLKNIKESVAVYQIPSVYSTSLTSQWDLGSTPFVQEHSSHESDLTVYSSGQWVLLHENCFQVETFCQNTDGTLTLQILSKSIQDDAAIQSLRPGFNQSPLIRFAYGDDGFLAKVRSVEAISTEKSPIWMVTLQPERIKNNGNILEKSYQGRKRFYSANDIAELKAKRLLLNDPPKLLPDARLFTSNSAECEMIENLITSSSTSICIEDCVVQSLYPVYKERPRVFLELARLEAIFFLKAGGIVEQVLELSLGLISPGKVHVRFRGKRRQIDLDVEPAVIEIEGDCSLLRGV